MAKGPRSRKADRKRSDRLSKRAEEARRRYSNPKLQEEPALEGGPEAATAAPDVEESLAYLSKAAEPVEEELLESEIFEVPAVPARAPEVVGPPAPPAEGGYLLAGQILLGLSFALFSESVQVLLPWGPNASGMFATATFLASMALMFQPIAALVDDIRRQTPGLSQRMQRAAGPICLGGGLALALVSAAGSGAGPAVTAENVRQMTLDWASRSGFNAQPDPTDPAYYFSYSMALKSGFPLTVQRTKANSDALTFVSTLRLSGAHKSAFSGMSGGQQHNFRQTLAAELDDPGLELRLEMPDAVQIRRTAPIGDLSRTVFHQTALDMDAALASVKSVVQRQAGG